VVTRFLVGIYDCCGYCRLKTTLQPFNGFFPGERGKLAPERQTILDFNEARDDVVALALAGPHANHLYLTTDR